MVFVIEECGRCSCTSAIGLCLGRMMLRWDTWFGILKGLAKCLEALTGRDELYLIYCETIKKSVRIDSIVFYHPSTSNP